MLEFQKVKQIQSHQCSQFDVSNERKFNSRLPSSGYGADGADGADVDPANGTVHISPGAIGYDGAALGYVGPALG